MYLNDHQRSSFYEALGMDTTKFNMHVLHETNKTVGRVFPQVIDTYNPEFKERLDNMVAMSKQLSAIGESDALEVVKSLQKLPIIANFVGELLALFLMKPVDGGTYDMASNETALTY
eukprot:jgi/Pico_ML_1/52648/g3325.t1